MCITTATTPKDIDMGTMHNDIARYLLYPCSIAKNLRAKFLREEVVDAAEED